MYYTLRHLVLCENPSNRFDSRRAAKAIDIQTNARKAVPSFGSRVKKDRPRSRLLYSYVSRKTGQCPKCGREKSAERSCSSSSLTPIALGTT